MPAYLVSFAVVDPGQVKAVPTITKGTTKPEGIPVAVIINPTSAQIQGVYGYLGLIKAGSTTTTVETAITALTP